MPALTPKQKKFADEWLIDHNSTRAALAAKYSKKTAGSLGSRLLKNVNVKHYIASRTEKLAQKLEISQERTLREIGRLAYFDPRKMYNADGSMKPIHEIDDDTAAAISSLETEEIKRKGKKVGLLKKWGAANKTSNLQILAKHFKIFEDITPVVVNNNVDISKLSAEELKVLLALKKKTTG